MNDEYVYFCPMRPPMLGSVPKDGLLYVGGFTERQYVRAIDCMAWGWAVYKRELTPREIYDYELIMKPREESK